MYCVNILSHFLGGFFHLFKNWIRVDLQCCRRRQWHPTPVLLPGKSHGWRSLEGCSPWSHWGSDMTERLHFHFAKSYLTLCDPMNSSTLPWPSLSPEVCSNSCPLSLRCNLTMLSSAAPVSFCLQSFPASGYFPMSWLFASGGQYIVASTVASVLSMNIQGWFTLGLIGLISLPSKGLSRVFSSTTVQKHQFFSAQPSLWSTSHIHTWPLEKP